MDRTQTKRHQSRPAEEPSSAATDWIGDYPISATLAALGIGVGIGFVLGRVAGTDCTRTLEGATSKAEKFGRQILDAVKTALPEAISRHMPE